MYYKFSQQFQSQDVFEGEVNSQEALSQSLADLPDLDTIFCAVIATHKWAPKASRGEIAREASIIWGRTVAHPEDERNWKLILCFGGPFYQQEGVHDKVMLIARPD